MIPRGAPDIGWRDLLFGLLHTVHDRGYARAQRAAEASWTGQNDTLACLSVRSGFDLVLQALALPPGSEVLVSAVTIPDMLRIIRLHGLHARPIDLDPASLSIDCAAVERAINQRTRAILVAPLWGSRMALDELAQLARQRGLLLIEDCAQAFDATGYRGHAGSDISLWSLGPIKTATALGGALLRVRDAQLLRRLRQIQAAYPVQSRRAYALRACRIAALKLLAAPVPFGLFVALCRARGIDHDRLIFDALRSYRAVRQQGTRFGGAELLPRLHQQPCRALLELLARRVRTADRRAMRRRAQRAKRIYQMLPAIAYPGAAAHTHTYWMIPILSRDPDGLVQHLWRHGFDATRRGSSLAAVPPTEHAPCAAAMLEQLVYLPVYPRLRARDAQRLCRAVLAFEFNDPRMDANSRE